jgi:hypothetical protein
MVYSRGRLIARTNDCKAHLDCRGIVQSETSTQWAIPDLASEGTPGAELSHEAAISPIAAEEVYYLMSRGVPKNEAVSMITRGFLDLEIPGLPSALRARIDASIEQTSRESMQAASRIACSQRTTIVFDPPPLFGSNVSLSPVLSLGTSNMRPIMTPPFPAGTGSMPPIH